MMIDYVFERVYVDGISLEDAYKEQKEQCKYGCREDGRIYCENCYQKIIGRCPGYSDTGLTYCAGYLYLNLSN